MPTEQWFDVDRKGLAALMERRGKTFAVMELIQNAWDTGATTVTVSLKAMPRGKALLTVVDDDPDGFADLRHAFTLFAPSAKKGDATKRGRFNLGEKLVLALCDTAEITSTKGRVTFGEDGRKTSRVRRETGSIFSGVMRLNAAEITESIAACHRLIVPSGVTLTVNGEPIEHRAPDAEVTVKLQTEIADDDGVLRRTYRNTAVGIHKVRDGETGTIYELGIPVVETGDPYHYDVAQKVPLSLERDNVPPSYLLALRTAALNTMRETLDAETANSAWARDALESPDVAPEAVEAVLSKRYGDKRVVYDPSDPEANKLAVMNGYTVIPSGSFSRSAWSNIRQTGAALPAGRVTPSPKPFSEDGRPLETIANEKWTSKQIAAERYARAMATHLVGHDITVEFTRDIGWGHAAAYGPSGRLIVNLIRAGRLFDLDGNITEEFDALLIHEFAHERVSDHLSRAFYDECCRLGAKFARWEKRQYFAKQPHLDESYSS